MFDALEREPLLDLQQMVSEEREVRRWCWTRGWRLASQASGLLPLARAAKAPELTAYLERLASYRELRPVPESEVAQRVRDLRRSRPGPEIVTGIERRGSEWCVPLARANIRPGTLHIDAESGRMFARED